VLDLREQQVELPAHRAHCEHLERAEPERRLVELGRLARRALRALEVPIEQRRATSASARSKSSSSDSSALVLSSASFRRPPAASPTVTGRSGSGGLLKDRPHGLGGIGTGHLDGGHADLGGTTPSCAPRTNGGVVAATNPVCGLAILEPVVQATRQHKCSGEHLMGMPGKDSRNLSQASASRLGLSSRILKQSVCLPFRLLESPVLGTTFNAEAC
jgi:hypothetical protein